MFWVRKTLDRFGFSQEIHSIVESLESEVWAILLIPWHELDMGLFVNMRLLRFFGDSCIKTDMLGEADAG